MNQCSERRGVDLIAQPLTGQHHDLFDLVIGCVEQHLVTSPRPVVSFQRHLGILPSRRRICCHDGQPTSGPPFLSTGTNSVFTVVAGRVVVVVLVAAVVDVDFGAVVDAVGPVDVDV